MIDHEFFMREAILEAKKAYAIGEVPIGAVVVQDEKIVGRGYNLSEKNINPTAHAEIVAIENACKNIGFLRLERSLIYVTAEPCIMCAGAIINARVERVIFGVKNTKFGGVVSLENIFDNRKTNHHVEWLSGILSDEIAELMQQFFKEQRAKKL